jgi:phosphoribosylamine-glycine ligase
MNIAIFSSRASYHHLAQLFEKEENVENIYHFGSNEFLKETDKYHPIPCDLENFLDDTVIDNIISNIEKIKIDFVMASGLVIPRSSKIHDFFNQRNIPYFFVYPGMTSVETDRITAKKLLENLSIPSPKGKLIDGKELKESFMTIPRPFVIKLIVWKHGRQTIIVNDENFQQVFLELFSIYLNEKPHIMNIGLDTPIWIEEYINIKKEYSYHMIVNQRDWKFFGAARDYKTYNEDDQGFNTIGMGAYNLEDIDPIVHDYADKLISSIQDYLKAKDKFYRGFMFFNIAIDKDDRLQILEINTRSGDPELNAILPTIENNLCDLFFKASSNELIPDVIHNSKKVVTIRLVNKIFDWTKPSSLNPKFSDSAEDYGITHSVEGTVNGNYFLYHSLFTASDLTYENANRKIIRYLSSQRLGQFKFRNDIGILK